jgi:hypothetical protein
MNLWPLTWRRERLFVAALRISFSAMGAVVFIQPMAAAIKMSNEMRWGFICNDLVF